MSLLTSFFEILFPLRCIACSRTKTRLCERCINKLSSATPLGGHQHAVFRYKDPIVQRAVRILKNKKDAHLANILGHAVSQYLLEILSDLSYQYPVDDMVITEIPMDPKSMRKRGFNQAALLATGISKHLPLSHTLRSGLLKKNPTKKQALLTKRADRFSNIKGTMHGSKMLKTHVRGKVVLLVDDIITTGATMEEGVRVLKKAGAIEVFCVAMAH
ncbi:MAG: competence protein ComFC [Planctomycetota bacterium]|jgi:competence protein ComFC